MDDRSLPWPPPLPGESPTEASPWPAPVRPDAPFAGTEPSAARRRLAWLRTSPQINVVLFLLTFLTTTAAGAFHAGVNPFDHPRALVLGLPFSCTLLLILLCHELGHYTLARYHGVPATLPFFMPAPPILVGTFGAFIRMRGMPASRRALFDVGAAGPWAGIVVAIPAVMLGLHWSEVRPLTQGLPGDFALGNSLLFNSLSELVLGVGADSATILLHPVALAGWFGMFVTFLNLLPIGQLDGGHVVYALIGRRHSWIAWPFFFVVLWMASLGWLGWLVFAAMLFGVVGVRHPDTQDATTPLDPKRRLAAWATIGIFVLTFMPVPFSEFQPADEPQDIRLERPHERAAPPSSPWDSRPDVRRESIRFDEGQTARLGSPT